MPRYFLSAHKDATQHAAVLYINAGAASVNAERFRNAWGRAGWKIDYFQGIDVAEFNYAPYVQQMKDKGIKLVNTMSNETLDEAGVLAKFGVRADQVLDLLALTGDAVDNVPGVAKVGPKTAAKWLAQYGTLDAVMAVELARLHGRTMVAVVWGGTVHEELLEPLAQGVGVTTRPPTLEESYLALMDRSI